MITEVKQGLGAWEIRLRSNTPRELLDILDAHWFGHIAIVPGRVDVRALGDGLLSAARYVGVFRQKFNQNDEYEIHGNGLNFWLGDSDGRGDLFASNVSFSASTFAATVRGLLPPSGSVIEGTIYSIGGSATYTGSFQWGTPREALNRICGFFTTSDADPVEWRVNYNGTLDAGKASQLYPSTTTPTAIMVRRKESGRDLATVSLEASLSLDADVEDYVTKMYVLGEGDGAAVPVGSASASPTPYRTLFNTPIVIAEAFNDPEASAAEVNVSAAIRLAETSGTRRAAQISTDEYDVRGTFTAGDTIMVFDPVAGFVNANNEIYWQGEPINPMNLRVEEVTWPIPDGWTVAFRDNSGIWWDLSNYYAPEAGSVSVSVGDFLRRLSGSLGPDLNGRAKPDSSIPAAPVFGTFYTGSYESLTTEGTRAQIQVSWTRPNNTDSSTITDLDHYEIRFRPNSTLPYPATWAQAATKRWNELLTWAQPTVSPLNAEWQTIIVGPDVTVFMLQELTCGINYDFQIRAADTASPPNMSAWSGTTSFVASRDQTAPNQPAPAEVASSRISIQVTHRLGSSAGGTYNLASDLDHIEIHVGGSSHFECEDSTRVGKLVANIGMMVAAIPAVGTFPIEPVDTVHVRCIAVDIAGNKSSPSDSATVSASLIDNAHISDLTVSKITAGTITSTWIMAGTIQTAQSGARSGMDLNGFFAYDPAGAKTFDVNAATGAVTTSGVFQTGVAGQRIVVADEEPFSTIKFYGTRESAAFAFINAVDFIKGENKFVGLGINAAEYKESDGILTKARLYMVDFGQFALVDAISEVPKGGGFYFDGDNAQMNFTLLSGVAGEDQHFYMNKDYTLHMGTWPNFVDAGATQGLFTGQILTGSNVTSVSVSYGATRASAMMVIATIVDNQTAANINRWQVSAQSTTGFTIDFGIATAGVAGVNMWCFRT